MTYLISGISSLMLLSRTGISLWKYEYLSLKCRSQAPLTAVTAFLTCREKWGDSATSSNSQSAARKSFKGMKANLRRVVKQPLGQVREHVVHVFPAAVLDDGARGLDDGHSHPGVLVSDGQHQGFDQTVSLHVEVLWTASGRKIESH